MEQPKVSASEMMALVRDTNAKVSAITEERGEGEPAKTGCSKIGTVFVIQIIVLGLFLTASVIFRSVLLSLGVVIPETILRFVYVGYALAAVLVASLVKTKMPLKIVASLAAIAPMAISFIIPLF